MLVDVFQLGDSKSQTKSALGFSVLTNTIAKTENYACRRVLMTTANQSKNEAFDR